MLTANLVEVSIIHAWLCLHGGSSNFAYLVKMSHKINDYRSVDSATGHVRTGRSRRERKRFVTFFVLSYIAD